MASFQINQDAKKENVGIPHKNPSQSAVLGKKRVLSVIGGTNLGVGGDAFKDGQDRTNITELNRNVRTEHAERCINGGSKVVLGCKIDNVCTGVVSLTSVLAAAGTNKSKAVPVLEQFKAISVYEDFNAIGKENENIGDEGFLPVAEKNDAIHKVFGDTSGDDYNLSVASMSFSEAFSPMSVDCTQIPSSSKSRSKDDIRSNNDAHREILQKSPRNDRQLFYDVPDYQREILEYFRETEKNHRPKPHYMERQTNINYSMRMTLVDWLVEVSEEYHMNTETLYLSVSYIDRFLSHMSVVRSKLQLVGTAAMLIASKYEEIYPPQLTEFVFITDDTYSNAQLLRMEQIVLKILGFDLGTPTAYAFINTYAVIAKLPQILTHLAQYICELSLLEPDPYLSFHPSIISAAALALARFVMKYPIWSPELEEISTYRVEDLKEVFLHLNLSHNAALKLSVQAIQEKYKATKYNQVSTISPAKITAEVFDEVVANYNEKFN